MELRKDRAQRRASCCLGKLSIKLSLHNIIVESGSAVTIRAGTTYHGETGVTSAEMSSILVSIKPQQAG